MFGWVRHQIKEHGVVVGVRLVGQVSVSRATATIKNKLLPATLMCPCCGWSGRRFHDYIEVGYRILNAMCPQCESLPRHRSLYLWVSRQFDLATTQGSALIFAPEKALAKLWSEAPHLTVHRMDIESARGVDLIADLQSLPITSATIDLIWCHHVLEHIQNDRAAIKELGRVLRPVRGALFVSVPMTLGTSTDEYGYPDPKQSGHWRMYGDDFEDRLAEGGLSVQVMELDLSAEERHRYGIVPERFYFCRRQESFTLADNHAESFNTAQA